MMDFDPPDPIVPVNHVLNGVYISGFRATEYPRELRRAAIYCVLKLYDGSPTFPPDFDVLDNALDDGEPITKSKMQRGVAYINEQVKAGNRVLVMCGAGISRSATFVLAYLLENGYDLHQAFDLLRGARPQVDPHPVLWQSLIDNYGLKVTLDQIMDWRRDL